VSFYVYVQCIAAGAHTVNFSDLILIPADEWLGYFDSGGEPIFTDSNLDIDSATYPRNQVVAWEWWPTTTDLYREYASYAAGPAILQANPGAAGLDLWCLQAGKDTAGGFTDQMHQPAYCIRAAVEGVHRYLSMRGNR